MLVAPKAVIVSLSDAAPDSARSIASVDAPGFLLAPLRSDDVALEAEPKQRFSRDARMATPAEFERCLRKPAVFRGGAFALHVEWMGPCDVHADAKWRLGLVIPKRYEASAVARNTIKRRWRDAFRRGRGAWAAEFGSVDVVVRLQAPLIPKPPKPAGRGVSKAAALPLPPARVRARDRFDAVALLGAFVDRLRSRGGRPAVQS